MSQLFWKTKTLAAMTTEEWESLCDGCGKCCLHKLEDSDSGELFHTNVACRLLDLKTARCRDYPARSQRVPDCIRLRPDDGEQYGWLPVTCAYRLRAEGRDLPTWHPLVAGDIHAVHRAGMSIRGWTVSEEQVDDIEDHIIHRTL